VQRFSFKKQRAAHTLGIWNDRKCSDEYNKTKLQKI
jgi:hypothetical protein